MSRGADRTSEPTVSGGDRPGSDRPAADQPTDRQPTGGQPVGGQPTGGQPPGGQSEVGQQEVGHSEGGQPAGGQPEVGQSAGGQSVGGQSVGGQSEGGQSDSGRQGASHGSADTLLDRYDALLLDLDGTVYRGGAVIDGAAEAVRAATANGVAVRFVTNNASRSPDDVADQLRRLGVPAEPDQVTTSAQAAAGMLAEALGADTTATDTKIETGTSTGTGRAIEASTDTDAGTHAAVGADLGTHTEVGAEVLVVGTEALAGELRDRGFRPVRTAGPGVRAVVQGLSQDTGWRELAEAVLAIRAGALWIACNVDVTLPTERGLLPGNGALVAAVRAATDTEPRIAGKPARPLLDAAISAAGARAPLVVGDRLDTDIAGAVTVGLDALLVLTGVSTAADLLAAPPHQRPRYVDADLRAVTRPAAETAIGPRPEWSVDVVGDRLRLHATDQPPNHPNTPNTPDTPPTTALGAMRALCAAWWAAGGGPVTVDAADDAARSALDELGLAQPA